MKTSTLRYVTLVLFGFTLGVTLTRHWFLHINFGSLENKIHFSRPGRQSVRQNNTLKKTSVFNKTKPRETTFILQRKKENLPISRTALEPLVTHRDLTKNPFWRKNDSAKHEHMVGLKGTECENFDETKQKNVFKYAYYFYAATEDYLCGAKILKAQIIALDGNKTDFVISTLWLLSID